MDAAPLDKSRIALRLGLAAYGFACAIGFLALTSIITGWFVSLQLFDLALPEFALAIGFLQTIPNFLGVVAAGALFWTAWGVRRRLKTFLALNLFFLASAYAALMWFIGAKILWDLPGVYAEHAESGAQPGLLVAFVVLVALVALFVLYYLLRGLLRHAYATRLLWSDREPATS